MSANYLYSNNPLPSLLPPQQQMVTQRSRSASASNATLNVGSQYQAQFSQPYQPLAQMEATWTQTQQGLYMNGLNKVVNLFPGSVVTDVEQSAVTQSTETYKFTPGIKLTDMNTRSCVHSYQPSSGNAVGSQGSVALGAQPMQFAVTATLNGATMQTQATSMHSDQTAVLHSNSHHPSGSLGQSFLIPGIMAQNLAQNNLSPSVYRDPVNTQALISSGSKQINTLNGTSARNIHTRLSDVNMPISQSAYVPSVPVQHPVASHQVYANSNLQPPMHNMVEYVPSMYTTNPNIHVPYTQQSTTLFGHYHPQLSAGFDSSVNPTFNSRIRHNTWAGLEENSAVHDISGRKVKNDKFLFANDYQTINEHNISSNIPFSQYGSSYPSAPNHSSFNPDGQKPDLIKHSGSVAFHNNDQSKSSCTYSNLPGLQFNSSRIPNKIDLLSTDNTYVVSKSNGHLPNHSVSQVHNTPYMPQSHSVKNNQSNNNVFPNERSEQRLNNHGNSGNRENYSRIRRKGREWGNTRDTITSKSTSNQQQSHSNNFRMKNGNIVNSQSVRSEKLPDGNGRKSTFFNDGTDKIKQTNLNQAHSNFVSTDCSVLTFPHCITGREINRSGPLNVKPSQNANFTFSSNAYPTFNHTIPQTETHDLCKPKQVHNYQPLSTSFNSVPNYLQNFPESLVTNLKLGGFRHVLDSCPTRMLLSTSLVGSIIGRGGRIIRLITAKTGARIGMKQDIIAFSQFSLPGKVKKPAPYTNTSALCEDSGQNDITVGMDKLELETHPVNAPPSEKHGLSNNISKCDENAESTELNTSKLSAENQTHSKLETQSDESQLVVLFGSREQCSAALCEILTICFRESKHRGFSDPCLGLLVEQHIYSHILMGRGRKYFNALHAAIGVRVSVTGAPIQIRSANPETPFKDDSKFDHVTNTDRILVIRGQLNSICATEAFISEQIRWATIESLIPPNLWPLLNHLPLNPSPNTTNKIGRSNNGSPVNYYDPQVVSTLIMSIASIFWPQSVCLKLCKTSSNRNRRSHQGQYPQIASDSNFAPNATKGSSNLPCNNKCTTLDPDSKSVSDHDLDQNDANSNVDDHDDAHEANDYNGSLTSPIQSEDSNDEQELCDKDECAQPNEEDNIISDLLHTSTVLEHEKVEASGTETTQSLRTPSIPVSTSLKIDQPAEENPITYPSAPKQSDFAMASAIQQSLIATVGPTAWLATGGVLYMRVAYNEAGALIGSEGSRIRQLMQSTGAEIHIGKTPISQSYLLSQALKQMQSLQTLSSKSQFDNVHTESDHLTNDEVLHSTPPSEYLIPTSGEANFHAPIDQKNAKIMEIVNDVTNVIESDLSDKFENEKSTSSIKGINENKMDSSNPESSQSDNLDAAYDFESKQSEVIKKEHTPTEIHERPISAVPDLCDSKQTDDVNLENNVTDSHSQPDLSKPIESKTQSYRLVTLSGTAQSQIMAQWLIFQRLKGLHRDQVGKDDSARQSCRSLFCLTTLICLPYRFLRWLTTHNAGFSYSTIHPSLITVCLSKLEMMNSTSMKKSDCSPLNWIQSLALKQMKANLPSDIAEKLSFKIIHILPEPRRRRKLVQEHLRRINAFGRGQTLSSHNKYNFSVSNYLSKNLVLPLKGLTNDGLDQLWTDPNRTPLEIYADYETTQFILTNIHQMLALWLYGQSLAGSPFPTSVQAPIFLYPPSGRPPSIFRPETNQHELRTRGQSTRQRTERANWPLAPRLDSYSSASLRKPVSMSLPGSQNSGASGRVHPAPLFSDGFNCLNPGHPFYYQRYPSLVGWPTIPNGKCPGQTVNSNSLPAGSTRPIRIRPPQFYSGFHRPRFDSFGSADKQITESNSSYPFPERPPNPRFPPPGYNAFITNLPPPPHPIAHTVGSSLQTQMLPGSCYRTPAAPQTGFQFSNPCGPFFINSMALLPPSNQAHRPFQSKRVLIPLNTDSHHNALNTPVNLQQNNEPLIKDNCKQ